MDRRNYRKKYRQKKLESYQLTKKLYRFLRHNPDSISLQKIRGGITGYYEDETEEIILDYRKELIPTLIHEFLHRIYPKWSETKIYAKERQMISVLSPFQCKNIIKSLSYCL